MSSNNYVNGESASWRLDYYKFKGLTFAQVLSKTLKNSNPSNQNITNQMVSSNKHSMSTNTVSNTCDSGAKCTKSKMGVNKCIWAPTKDRVSEDVKAGQAACYNRYEVLYQGDDVVSQTPDTAIKHVHHTHISKENDANGVVNIKPDSPKCENVSFNDAHLNPRKKNTKSKVQLQKQSKNKSPLDSYMQNTSKYDLHLRFKDKTLDYTQIMASCPNLQLWDKHNSFKFGFIPSGDLDISPTSVTPTSNTDPLTLHQMVKASGE